MLNLTKIFYGDEDEIMENNLPYLNFPEMVVVVKSVEDMLVEDIAVLVLGDKETVKFAHLRSKYEHGSHNREGEEMLKDGEQLSINRW